MADEMPIPSPSSQARHGSGRTAGRRVIFVGAILVLVAILALAVWAVVAMVDHPAATQNIRDIVIIFVALESLFLGLALIVLIVQLARLTTLLQDEVKPILDSTKETLSTLRGTTTFLSDNLVQPVIKANSTMAALRRALDLFRPGRAK